MLKKIIVHIFCLCCVATVFSQESAPAPSDDLNWISNIRFDLKGNTVSKGVNYFNTLGKSTQGQSWDILTNKIWAAQTLYDYQGRSALRTLGAPTGTTFGYQSSFMQKANGSTFSIADFDESGTIDNPATVGNQSNSLGWYYSDSNTSEPYQDVTEYPYSRTIFSRLNPGQALKTVGGNKVEINNVDQWANGYSFTMPVAQELHYAYGKDHFPVQRVTEEACVEPPIVTTTLNYFYDLTPINIDDCSLNTSGNLTGVKLDHQQNVLYEVNKIYKIDIIGNNGYFKITGKTQVSDPNNFTVYGAVSCGPYTNCTDVYQIADYIKATKTVVRDVHGIESVVFTDSEGNTLAAARSGDEGGQYRKKYSVVSTIGEQGFVDLHIPVGCGGTVTFKGPSSARFNVYDLITEVKTHSTVGTLVSLNPGIYRIEETTTFHKNPLPYVQVNGSSIDLLDNTKNVGVSYRVNYYDYSLNFYDKASRLTKSVQPEGFDDTLSMTNSVRNHQLESTYSYNTLGQLLTTSSPDEGTANFKYRTDGQIRYSQNSKQTSAGEFSYTNYDNLGRPVESGVITNSTFSTVDPDASLPSGTKKEQHVTVYDMPDSNLATVLSGAGISSANYNQQFTAGNVSKTYTSNPSTTTTWYSYDAYGRVTWVVQDIDGLGVKTIDYEYDFAKGHVTKVIYQKYKSAELFVHQYNYNDASQLTSVQTSTDDTTFTTQESYTYYETGALKRKELLNNIQGTDYVYNINGQLKAINHPGLDASLDPGGDSDDAFGLMIDYHQKDYARSQRSNITTTTFGTDQFNGNIKTTRWNTKDHVLTAPKQNAYNYVYDKNNWLNSATYGELVTGNTTDTNMQTNVTSTAVTTTSNSLTLEAINSITLSPGFHAQSGSDVSAKVYTLSSFNQQNSGDYNVSDITYDANGNIKTLARNKNTESGSNVMDDFTYHYKTGKNQLDRVQDDVTTTTNADDLKTQAAGNYIYNSIGQLTENIGEAVKYTYNASGLITEVKKNNVTLVKFFYNDKGHRVKKEIYNSGGSLTRSDYYVRDAAGSVMAIYEDATLKEQPIYGASRIGIYKRADNSSMYQLTDHLGNVRAVVNKNGSGLLAMLAYTDYYPFGMPMPNRNVEGNYRYKYQGQEKDPETGKEAFELRLWDGRIGRWLSPDPAHEFHSPYLGIGNDPINFIDKRGDTIRRGNGITQREFDLLKSRLIKKAPTYYDILQNAKQDIYIHFKNAPLTTIATSSGTLLQGTTQVTYNSPRNLTVAKLKYSTIGKTTYIDVNNSDYHVWGGPEKIKFLTNRGNLPNNSIFNNEKVKNVSISRIDITVNKNGGFEHFGDEFGHTIHALQNPFEAFLWSSITNFLSGNNKLGPEGPGHSYNNPSGINANRIQADFYKINEGTTIDFLNDTD